MGLNTTLESQHSILFVYELFVSQLLLDAIFISWNHNLLVDDTSLNHIS